MYKKLLFTITTGSILMLAACSGGVEGDLKTAINTDKERMPVCGKYHPSAMSISLNGMSNTKIRTYPVKDLKPKNSGPELFRNGSRQCYGSRSVNEIIEFTTPSDFAGKKMTEVVFSYEMELNDLARYLRVGEAIQNAYAKPLQAKAILIETNKGWRVDKIRWNFSDSFRKSRLIISEKYAREQRPNCAACQDLVKNNVDFSKISKKVTGQFRDRNHFYGACNSVRQSCANADVRY